MSTSGNAARVRRSIEEQYGPGNLSVLEQNYAADFVVHDPANPQLGDLASTMAFIAEVRATFPDAAVTIEDQIAEGDRVATRWTFRGTNSGAVPDSAPPGIAVWLACGCVL